MWMVDGGWWMISKQEYRTEYRILGTLLYLTRWLAGEETETVIDSGPSARSEGVHWLQRL